MRSPITLRSAGARAAAIGLLTLMSCSKAPTEPTALTQGPLAGDWTGTIRGAGTQGTIKATISQIGNSIGISFETKFFETQATFHGSLNGSVLAGQFTVAGPAGVFGCSGASKPASGTGAPSRIRLDLPEIPTRGNILTYIACPGAPASTIDLSR